MAAYLVGKFVVGLGTAALGWRGYKVLKVAENL
jgi:hypothetical protein